MPVLIIIGVHFMQYSLDVIGTTHQGFLGSYTYKMLPKDLPEGGAITPQVAKRFAGDFSSLKDYRVTKLETHSREVSKNVHERVFTETVLRDWEDSHSGDIFQEMNAAA